jgi:quercetin dioxygenase-like cupin family protein
MLRRWDSDEEPVARASRAVVTSEGGITRRRIVGPGDFGSAAFTVTEVEVAPGASDVWHRHPGAEHALVVFEGRGSVTVGDETETLEPLKGIRVEEGRPHRVENTGRTPLRYYVCASPGLDPIEDRAIAEAPRRRSDA